MNTDSTPDDPNLPGTASPDVPANEAAPAPKRRTRARKVDAEVAAEGAVPAEAQPSGGGR